MNAEITPETLRLAEEGATVISDAVHGKNPTVTACLSQAAAIRDLIAHATETCEQDKELDTLLQDLFNRLAGLMGCQQTDQQLGVRVASMLSKVQARKRLTEIAAKQQEEKEERT